MKTSSVLLIAAFFSLTTFGIAFAGDPTVDVLDQYSTWSGYSHLSQGEPSEVSLSSQNAAGTDSNAASMITAQADSIDSKAEITLPEAD